MKEGLLWALLLLSAPAFSQTPPTTGGDTALQAMPGTLPAKRAPEAFMTGQIKHIGDFINRFNKMADDDTGINALFDEDDSRLARRGMHAYTNQVTAFAQAVAQEKIRIPKQPVMRALAGMLVNFKGVADTLFVELQKDYTADSAAYWHVTKVKAPRNINGAKKETIPRADEQVRVELPPNAHEVSFLPLLRGLHDYQSITPFTHCRDCRDDDWRIVENALRSGKLTAEGIVSNRIFLTLGNWEVELREFIREKENSGWLISNLIEK